MALRFDDVDLDEESAASRAGGRLARLASICTSPSTLMAAIAVAALAAAIAIVPASQPHPRPMITPPEAASGSYSDGSAGNSGSRDTDPPRTAGAPAAHGSGRPTPATTTVPVAAGPGSAHAPGVTPGTAAPGSGVSQTLPELEALGLPSIPPITIPIHPPLPGMVGQSIPDVIGAVTAPLTTGRGPTTTVPLVSGLLDQVTKNLKR